MISTEVVGSAPDEAMLPYQPKFEAHWPEVEKKILKTWELSKVTAATPQMPGSLKIPHEFFTIAEARHRGVLYGWDTYFTCLGLQLVEDLAGYAKNAADNQIAMIQQIGFVPNASEPWALNRAQLPFLSMLVREVYEQGLADRLWLQDAYSWLLKDYHFWTDDSADAIESHTTPIPGLQRYSHHSSDADLLAMYGRLAHRFGFATDIPDEEKIAFAGRWLPEAETMDFTPRFENRCADFIAIDLNSNLYRYEKNFAWMVNELKLPMQPDWEALAEQREKLIMQYCWNEERGLFMDYDYVNKRFSRIASVAAFYPLWTGLATEEQARRTVANLNIFEYAHGPVVCEKTEQALVYQWDYPAGWPPMYHLVARALEDYGYRTDARRIAAKYLDVVARNFLNPEPVSFTNHRGVTGQREPGYVYEKYDAVTGLLFDAEYPSRRFHGWSYGVFIWALDYYRQTMPTGAGLPRENP